AFAWVKNALSTNASARNNCFIDFFSVLSNSAFLASFPRTTVPVESLAFSLFSNGTRVERLLSPLCRVCSPLLLPRIARNPGPSASSRTALRRRESGNRRNIFPLSLTWQLPERIISRQDFRFRLAQRTSHATSTNSLWFLCRRPWI